MTTLATGSVSMVPNPTSTTVSARLTTSIQNLPALQQSRLPPPQPPVTPSQIVTGKTTMIPDAPGFTMFPPRLLFCTGQVDAIRSAATNTAAAFGIDITIAADTATIEQLTLVQKTARLQPTVIVEQVVIPP